MKHSFISSRWVTHLAHYDVIKWKHFPRYWPFVRRIHRSPVSYYQQYANSISMLTFLCLGGHGKNINLPTSWYPVMIKTWISNMFHLKTIQVFQLCSQLLIAPVDFMRPDFSLTSTAVYLKSQWRLNLHLSTCSWQTENGCQLAKINLDKWDNAHWRYGAFLIFFDNVNGYLWDEITYQFQHFSGAVWEWISNFIRRLIMDLITYPCWINHIDKMGRRPECINCLV